MEDSYRQGFPAHVVSVNMGSIRGFSLRVRLLKVLGCCGYSPACSWNPQLLDTSGQQRDVYIVPRNNDSTMPLQIEPLEEADFELLTSHGDSGPPGDDCVAPPNPVAWPVVTRSEAQARCLYALDRKSVV